MNRQSIDNALVLLVRLAFAMLFPWFLYEFLETAGRFNLGVGFWFAFQCGISALVMLVGSVVVLALSVSLGDPGNGQSLAEPTGITWMRRCILLIGAIALLAHCGVEMFDAYIHGVNASG